MPSTRQTLYVSPSLRVRSVAGNKVILTRKFIDGMLQYVKHWPGPVAVLAEPTDQADGNLDHIEIAPTDLPFGLKLAHLSDTAILEKHLLDAKVILASLDHKQTHLPDLCRPLGVPVVYATEYTSRTRRQIIAAEVRNPILRLRRTWWSNRIEVKYRQAVRQAAALQCNGTPTFRDYESINPNRLLYFDTRVSESMLASDADLAARTGDLLSGKPLRLVFSGRLIAMKGAGLLIPVATELKKLGIPFSLNIFGNGDLRPTLESQIKQAGLDQQVFLRGVLDFARELMPQITHHADLFVCCHPQGDPSCTYLETLSCGVPIAGFDNEAFAGLVEQSDPGKSQVNQLAFGWTSPMNDTRSLAALIARLAAARSTLAAAARAARDFAAQHTFEKTFAARIAHLIKISEGKY